jgi:mediator of RNA polymerase II transcription subunit 16
MQLSVLTSVSACDKLWPNTDFMTANTLLIAFATTSNQLRTVRAMIDWGLPKSTEKVNPANLPLNPTIKTRHLAVTSWHHDAPTDTSNGSQIEQSMAQLTHLEFLPPSVDPSGRMTPPTIITMRSYLPPMSHYNQDVYTTVDKWEVRERVQTIHSAFEQLSSRRNSVGTKPGVSETTPKSLYIFLLTDIQPVIFLKKLEGFTVNKIAISMQQMNLSKIVIFAYSDSMVEYRDRFTMAETLCDGDLSRVWHLAQIGFSYTDDEPCKLHLRPFLVCY